jgi:hypothetical protein
MKRMASAAVSKRDVALDQVNKNSTFHNGRAGGPQISFQHIEVLACWPRD